MAIRYSPGKVTLFYCEEISDYYIRIRLQIGYKMKIVLICPPVPDTSIGKNVYVGPDFSPSPQSAGL